MMCAIQIHSCFKRLLLLLPVYFTLQATAQEVAMPDSAKTARQYRYIIKAGSPLSGFKSGILGHEFRLKKGKSLTFTTEFNQYGSPSKEGVFYGQIRTHYIEDKYKLMQIKPSYRVIQESAEYNGTKPVPRNNEFFPVLSLTFDFGIRLVTINKNRFYSFLEPGVTSTWHRYYDIRHSIVPVLVQMDRKILGNDSNQYIIEQVTTDYVQIREMNLHNTLMTGVSYKLGTGYRLSKRLLVELQGGGTLLFGKAVVDQSIREVKNLRFRYMLFLGYAF